jgi:hypothetical protein
VTVLNESLFVLFCVSKLVVLKEWSISQVVLLASLQVDQPLCFWFFFCFL